LGLISCREEAMAAIAAARSGKTTCLAIPDLWTDARAGGPDGESYWRSLAGLPDRLDGIRPGDVWLVGAGIWGKLCCDRIRRQGGIAIDIGSVFDLWVGRMSRPQTLLLLRQRHSGTPPGAVPEALLLARQLAGEGG
ncbi:MAG: hypothetical protein ACP5EN_11065, partial [Rhodovulum sp.]